MLVIKQERIQEEKCTSLPSRRLLPSRVDKALQRRSKSKLITEAQMLASVKSRVVSSNSRSRQQMILDVGLEGWEWIEITEWKEEAPDKGNIISIDAVIVVYLLSHVPLFCDPMECSPPGLSVHGIFQARILEWVAISSTRGSPQPRDRTCVSCISCTVRWILYHWATRED